MFNKGTSRYYLCLIIGFSLLLKLMIFAWLNHLGADFTLPDSGSYIWPAKTLLSGGAFFTNPGLWMRTPIYPLLIAGIYALFGESVQYIVIFQIFISTLLVVNAYRITSLLSTNKLALFAAGLVSIDYLFLSYTNLIMTDLLFAVVISFVLYYAIKYLQEKGGVGTLFIVGLLLAVATLIRPVSYYLVPLMAVILFFYTTKKSNALKAFKFSMVFLLPFIVCVGGWQLRNKAVVGTYQFTNIDAINLYHYYAADNLAYMQGISITRTQDKLKKQVADLFPDNGIEKYSYYRSKGIEVLLHNPQWSAVQFMAGFMRTMFGNDYILLYYNSKLFFHGKDLENEIFHFHFSNLTYIMSSSDWIKFIFISLFFVFNFLILLMAGYFVKNALSKQRQLKPVIIFMLIFVGYFVLVSSNYCSLARFRLPFEIVLDCFSVLGCVQLAENRRLKQKKIPEDVNYASA